MFRKLVFAVTLALGMGGGALAVTHAQAAVIHPAASNALVQAIEQTGPAAAATEVQYRRHYGYRHGYRHYGYHRRGYGYRHGYYGHRRCRWVNRRVYHRHRVVWVRRRVCW